MNRSIIQTQSLSFYRGILWSTGYYLELRAKAWKKLVRNDEDENVGVFRGLEQIRDGDHILGKLIT